MNNCPVFYRSLAGSTASKVQVELWDECLDTFDKKEYLKSFHLLMDYANAELRPKYGNAAGTSFKIPHGSIVLNLEIEGDSFSVKAPFLEVNQSSVVPLLRQICTLNFNNMDLAQIYLRDNRLDFEYSCKLNELNPYKMYYLLKEICMTGDKYDDEFVTKFGAKRVYEPIVKPFSPDKAERAYQVIQEFLKEALEYISYFESKRWYSMAWDMAGASLRKLDYYAHPQGQLINDLSQAISDMYDESISLPETVTRAKTYMQKLLDTDKATIMEDLYEVEFFISSKRRSTLQNIQENLEKVYDRSREGMANKAYMGLSLDILFNFYNMYYYNDLQEDVSQVVADAMEKASGKTWDVAANALFGALDKIMNGNLAGSGKKGGLFSRLFGK